MFVCNWWLSKNVRKNICSLSITQELWLSFLSDPTNCSQTLEKWTTVLTLSSPSHFKKRAFPPPNTTCDRVGRISERGACVDCGFFVIQNTPSSSNISMYQCIMDVTLWSHLARHDIVVNGFVLMLVEPLSWQKHTQKGSYLLRRIFLTMCLTVQRKMAARKTGSKVELKSFFGLNQKNLCNQLCSPLTGACFYANTKASELLHW